MRTRRSLRSRKKDDGESALCEAIQQQRSLPSRVASTNASTTSARSPNASKKKHPPFTTAISRRSTRRSSPVAPASSSVSGQDSSEGKLERGNGAEAAAAERSQDGRRKDGNETDQGVATLSPATDEGRSQLESILEDNVEDAASLGKDSPPPPIKEIHTSTKRNIGRTSTNDKVDRSEDGPKYLDETTLALVKTYLGSNKGDVLDEDDVVDFTMRLHRIANQQARYQTALVAGRTTAKAADASDNSEAGSDDTSIFNECLGEEEEHAVGHDLFKKTVMNIQQRDSKVMSVSATNGGSSKTSVVTGSKLLDKKTLTWIKRAAGLHRSGSGTILVHDKKSGAQGGRMTTRRYTRKQARDSRQKKRERGLDILCDAVADLEDEYGPFPIRATRKTVRSTKTSLHTNDASSDEEQVEAPQNKRKKGRLAFEIEVPPRKKHKDVKPSKENEAPSPGKSKRKGRDSKVSPTKSKSLGNKKLKSKSRNKQVLTKTPPPETICTSLRVLDWVWRNRTQQFRNAEDQMETAADYRARKCIPLHPQFVKAGIVHRIPRMHTFAREHQNPYDSPRREYDSPRRRHTNKVYAELCGRLMICLQGQARQFATCEFFYSDLDREWYKHNPFADEAEKHGVPREALLTWNEWMAIRRRMKKKPRRFSRNFIISQLSERNEYRSTVRMLQNNPHLSSTTRLPYTIYLPIRVGSLVTSYSKRFRIIQRGRVLAYDRSTALYLIEFENRQFGFELCPDSHVATCGLPEIMIRCTEDFLLGRPISSDLTLPPPGSGTGPLQGILRSPLVKADSGLAQTIQFCPTRIIEADSVDNAHPTKKPISSTSKPLLERVANQSAFVLLLGVIDTARNRKRDLLSLIEDANTLAVEHLPFGSDDNTLGLALSRAADEHVSWLRGNLERTNQILVAALDYQRTLYGNAYLPSSESRNRENEPVNRFGFLHKFLDATQASRGVGHSMVPDEWSVNLAANAESVGRNIASLVMANVNGPGIVQAGHSKIDLQERVSAAGQLVSTASYIMSVANGPLASEGYSALDVAAKKLSSEVHARVHARADRSHNLYDEVLIARDSAVNELKEALDLFKSELQMSNLNQLVGVAQSG